MDKYKSYQAYFICFSFFIFFIQIQINYFLGTNIKLFEAFSILAFMILIPFLIYRKINFKNFYLLTFLISIILYCNIILILKFSNLSETVNGYSFDNYKLWKFFSVYNYLSILFLSSLLLLLKKNELEIIFKIFYILGILILIEAGFHLLLLFFGFQSIWSSDFISGHRFQSFLLHDSSETALILFISYLFFTINYNFKNNNTFLLIFIIFLVATILTKERSIILLFSLFNFFYFIKYFKKNKLKFFFYILILGIISYNLLYLIRTQGGDQRYYFNTSSVLETNESLPNFNIFHSNLINVNKSTAFSIKSSISRLVLLIRSYEISKEFFPFGTGPGSQVLFIYNDLIDFDVLESINNNISLQYSDLGKLILLDINQFFKKTGDIVNCDVLTQVQKGKFVVLQHGCVKFFNKNVRTMSPHNLFADLSISLGLLGILFSLILISIMSYKLLSYIFSQLTKKSLLNLAVSMFFIMFMFGSYYNVFWIFIFLISLSNYNNLINE
tara:strand:+ start:13629 stop:15128 length:1500 start_codon:yes stop_codon:yes gene_type:complete